MKLYKFLLFVFISTPVFASETVNCEFKVNGYNPASNIFYSIFFDSILDQRTAKNVTPEFCLTYSILVLKKKDYVGTLSFRGKDFTYQAYPYNVEINMSVNPPLIFPIDKLHQWIEADSCLILNEAFVFDSNQYKANVGLADICQS